MIIFLFLDYIYWDVLFKFSEREYNQPPVQIGIIQFKSCLFSIVTGVQIIIIIIMFIIEIFSHRLVHLIFFFSHDSARLLKC